MGEGKPYNLLKFAAHALRAHSHLTAPLLLNIFLHHWFHSWILQCYCWCRFTKEIFWEARNGQWHWPIRSCKERLGWVVIRKVYFWRRLPITRSTWILTRVLLDFNSCKLLFSFSKCWRNNCSTVEANRLFDVKPRSARSVPPGSKLCCNPELTVRYLSLTLPPHPSDI